MGLAKTKFLSVFKKGLIDYSTVEGQQRKKPVKFRDAVNSRKTTLEDAAAPGPTPMQT